jgi:hypothetical protein
VGENEPMLTFSNMGGEAGCAQLGWRSIPIVGKSQHQYEGFSFRALF